MQVVKDLLGKYFFFQIFDSNLLFVFCCFLLEMKFILFIRYFLSYRCLKDRELSLKLYICCMQGSIFYDQVDREDVYVYFRVYLLIMEKRVRLIFFYVFGCFFLEVKWCSELFMIIVF